MRENMSGQETTKCSSLSTIDNKQVITSPRMVMEPLDENKSPIPQSSVMSTPNSHVDRETFQSETAASSNTAKGKAVHFVSPSPQARSAMKRSPRIWAMSKLGGESPDPSTWKPAHEILSDLPISEATHEIVEAHRILGPARGTLYNRCRLPSVPEESLTPEEMTMVEDHITGKTKSGGREFLDLRQHARARVYNFYISRLDKLKILCDDMNRVTDFPALTPEDFALLRTLTITYGTRRWWKIPIRDIACPECVTDLKARRMNHNYKFLWPWRAFKSQIRRIYRAKDDRYDFVCTHTGKDTNKVTRFFHALGKRNASRIVNIELETDRSALVDPDVLASAVHNIGHYLPCIEMLSVRFHFCAAVAVNRKLIADIVSSLTRMEALLPEGGRLLVRGFENHVTCQRAWAKKSRKWWQ